MAQIRKIKEVCEQIETLSNDSMYAEPVKKIQEQLYDSLLTIREGFHKTLEIACQEAERGNP